MKKSTFLIVAGIAASVTMFFECSDTYSSEAIRRAELGTLSKTTPKYLTNDVDYIISLNGDSIKVIDPNTGKAVLTEKYNSGSTLAEAMLRDNL